MEALRSAATCPNTDPYSVHSFNMNEVIAKRLLTE